jgi:Tfp pilus assembly protein PilO
VNVQTIGAIGLLVLLGAWGYFALLAPKLAEVKALRVQVARAGGPFPAQPVPSVSPITDEERNLWAELEQHLRGRYPGEPELPRAARALATLARSSGMALLSLELQTPPTGPPADPAKAPPAPPFRPPPELAVNPATIKLVLQHRYRDLVTFLEGVRRLPVYVTVQSLEVKRMEDRLTTEVSFASFRWGK